MYVAKRSSNLVIPPVYMYVCVCVYVNMCMCE